MEDICEITRGFFVSEEKQRDRRPKQTANTVTLLFSLDLIASWEKL